MMKSIKMLSNHEISPVFNVYFFRLQKFALKYENDLLT